MFRGWNIRKRGYMTADEAMLEGTRIRTEIIQGNYNPDKSQEKLARVSLSEYFNSIYYSAKKNSVKASSLRTYKQCFNNWIAPVCGKTQLVLIGSKHAQRVLDRMNGAETRPATQKTVMQVFRAMINHAVSAGYRETGITLPKVSGKAGVKRVLSPEEVNTLIRSSKEVVSEEFSRLITTLYLSGLRIGELVALRTSDIDLQAHHITIARRYYENVEEAGRWDVPKNGKIQTIPIHPELVQVLREQMIEASNNKVSELLFTNSNGTVLSPRSVRETMKKVANIAMEDSTGVTPHALRRSIASTLVDSNLPIDSVADYLRHGTQVLQSHYNKPNRKLFRANFSGLRLIVNGDN